MQFFAFRETGPPKGLLFRMLAFVMLLTSISLLTIGCSRHHHYDGQGKGLTGIIVTPQVVSITEGMSMKLTALGVLSNGSTVDVTEDVEWSSDNAEIVSVSNGRITGIKAGSAVITASFGASRSRTTAATGIKPGYTIITAPFGPGRSGTAAVTVLKAEQDRYIVAGASGVITDKITIIEGLNEQVRAFAVLDDGASRDITDSVKWTSDNSAVAAASKGLISAHKAGKAKITVRLTDDTIIAEFTVEVVKDEVTSITLNKSKLSVAAGYGDTLTAWATFSSGKSADISASAAWKSSDAKIASVKAADFEAIVSGVAAGSAEITASFGGKSASCSVTVTQAELASIAFIKSSVTVVKGLYEDLAVIGSFSDGTTANITKNVALASDNAKAAVVEASGRVRGVSAGRANITAKAKNGLTAQAAVEVIDAQVASLTVSGKSSVIPGYTQQLTAKASFTDGSQKDVTDIASWSSSNPDSAMVASGLVRALKSCEAPVVITASLDGVSAAKNMTVKSAKVTSLTVIGDTDTVIAGYSIRLTALAAYSDGTSEDVTEIAEWSTGSDTTAIVNKGLVTGKAAGSAAITAKLEGAKAARTVKVSDAVVTELTIEGESATVAAGRSVALTAKAKFSDGTGSVDVTDDIIWTSSDSSIAIITGGRLLGRAAGSVTVTAVSANGVKVTKKITVTDAQITSLLISGNDSVALGYTTALTATAVYSDNRVEDVTGEVEWSANNNATVDENGIVTGAAAGTASITASIKGIDDIIIQAAKDITVTDTRVTDMSISCSTDIVALGSTIDLAAIASFSDGTGGVDVTDSVIWKSGDNTIAMVTEGKVIGLAEGQVTITATSVNGVEAEITITVGEPEITSLVITGDSLVIAGSTVHMQAYASYSDGSSGYVTDQVKWSSEQEEYAEPVEGTPGDILGIAAGTATITAAVQVGDTEITESFALTVTDAVPSYLAITGDTFEVDAGKTIDLAAIAELSDGSTDVDITNQVVWDSSDKAIAMVTAGKVIGLAEGQAVISASINGITAEATVTVHPAQPAPADLLVSIRIEGFNEPLAAGQTCQLTLKGVKESGEEVTITENYRWIINESFASIDDADVMRAADNLPPEYASSFLSVVYQDPINEEFHLTDLAKFECSNGFLIPVP